LRQNLVAWKNNLRDTEEKQADNWVRFSNDLTEEHNRLQERKNQLEALISLNKENIEIAEEALEYHTLELENAQEGLAHEENWCAQQENIYEEQSGYRYLITIIIPQNRPTRAHPENSGARDRAPLRYPAIHWRQKSLIEMIIQKDQ
jgi:hypothetical protein